MSTTETPKEEGARKEEEAPKYEATEDTKEDEKEPKKENAPIPAWLSLEMRVDDVSIKKEQFEISGWINVLWKWTCDHSDARDTCPESCPLYHVNSIVNSINMGDDDKEREEDKKSREPTLARRPRAASRVQHYKTGECTKEMKIGDLRESDISYYLPIDANKIFNQPTLLKLTHIEAPCLYYNIDTNMTHTRYYINAILSQPLELFTYPFDHQYLDLKLRWNEDYYRWLDYDKDEDIRLPRDDQWFPTERKQKLHYVAPVQIYLKESLRDDVTLYSPKKDRVHYCTDENVHGLPNGLRCALIRIRIRRNPCYVVTNIIMPFIIIVSSSFSAYAISPLSEGFIGSRLSVSMTILLAFTVFQSLISDQLHETSQMSLFDWFITLGYVLQSLIICSSCILALNDEMDEDRIKAIDSNCATVAAILWIVFSVFFVSLAFEPCRKCYDKLTSCCCYSDDAKRCCGCMRCKKVYYNDWEKRGKQAKDEWIASNTEKKVIRNPLYKKKI